MELLNVVDDFFVTASLALLLTFIVLKLVDAVNDTHSTPKRHVPRQPVRPVSHAKPLTVQPAENKSKVSVISPVQASTCVKTESKIEDDTIQPVHSVPIAQLNPVQPATCDEIEHKIKEPVFPVPTVQLPQNENTVAFINPVQAATCAETESKIEDATVQPVPIVQLSPVQGATCEETECNIEEATVEPVLPVQPVQCDSTVDLISPVQTATCIETEHMIEEGTVESDSAEKQNVESVEEISEISVEPSSEIEVSVVDSSVKENDDHNHDHVDVDVDDDDDDDWEGIERSELEKEFMAATEFVNGEDNRLGIVGSNVQMELYGLHKIATEGSCREPQPMPLKISARAKWNAWQKLGNMNPEDAMEQYISLLSDNFPGWVKDTSAGMNEEEPTRPEVSDSAASDLSSTLSHQQMIVTERELEQESDSKDRGPLTKSDLEDNVKK